MNYSQNKLIIKHRYSVTTYDFRTSIIFFRSALRTNGARCLNITYVVICCNIYDGARKTYIISDLCPRYSRKWPKFENKGAT